MYKFNKVSDLAGYDNKSQHFEKWGYKRCGACSRYILSEKDKNAIKLSELRKF